MGFFDAFMTAAGKAAGTAAKKLAETTSEAREWRDRLDGKSDEELKQIARIGSPMAKKMGACLLLKERGYGKQD